MKPRLCLLLLLAGLCAGDMTSKHGKTSRKDKHEHSKGKIQPTGPSVLDPDLLPSPEEKLPKSLSIADISEMNTDFAFNLYRQISNKHDDNIFFSPFSVSYALASLMLGTQGTTQEQILEGLNLSRFKNHENPHLLPTLLKTMKEKITKNEDLVLDVGSFSFVDDNFSVKEGFRNLTSEFFDMEYQNINFRSPQAKNIINNYINKKTNGKISQLYDDLDPQTKLVLLDYIQFKGKWKYPFNPELTETETFFINQYSSVKVPMMYKADRISFMSDKDMSCTVLKLPYRGRAHLLIVMPEKEGDFMVLEDHLTKELVDNWLAKMKSEKIDIFFPKFKLDQKYQLKSLLQELGIKEVFTGRANLTELTEERSIKLTEVTQRAVIEVDERGTEASAATGMEIVAFSLPPTIRVNRPFLFMIIEEITKAVLFIGRVIDPTKL